jgi:hypothetical protein
MKTKDFIKLLQEEDPTGEAHIRMNGGVPVSVIAKEGYWDGPYQYIDEEGNFVTSIKNDKVDIYCIDVYEFVGNNINRNDPDNWEKIRAKFKFELGAYVNDKNRNEKEEAILKEAKEAFDGIMEIEIRMYNASLEQMRENAKKGWKWFQNKLVDTESGYHHYYTWKIFDENDKSMGPSNPHMTESIQESGEWEKLDNNVMEGYYEWRFKIN